MYGSAFISFPRFRQTINNIGIMFEIVTKHLSERSFHMELCFDKLNIKIKYLSYVRLKYDHGRNGKERGTYIHIVFQIFS